MATTFALVVAGCGVDRPGDEYRDGDGILGSDVPMTATTEEAFVVGGGASGEKWALFSQIGSLDFTVSGDLALLDVRQKRIVVVASDGSFRHEIPRPGEGPADLEAPISLVAMGDGRLLAWDLGHRAFLVLDADGALTGRIQVESSGRASMIGFGRVLRAMPDGRILAAGMSGDGLGRGVDVFSLDGVRQRLYTAWEMPGTADHASPGEIGIGVEMREPPKFAASLLVDVLPDGRVAVVDSVDYRIKLISGGGTVEGTLESRSHPSTSRRR